MIIPVHRRNLNLNAFLHIFSILATEDTLAGVVVVLLLPLFPCSHEHKVERRKLSPCESDCEQDIAFVRNDTSQIGYMICAIRVVFSPDLSFGWLPLCVAYLNWVFLFPQLHPSHVIIPIITCKPSSSSLRSLWSMIVISKRIRAFLCYLVIVLLTFEAFSIYLK